MPRPAASGAEETLARAASSPGAPFPAAGRRQGLLTEARGDGIGVLAVFFFKESRILEQGRIKDSIPAFFPG